jgi:hypothetical protein
MWYKRRDKLAKMGCDMEPVELRDLDVARRFVAEGLWLQRAVKPSAATARAALEWAMELASGGNPLPPVGFVSDAGHIAFGSDLEHRANDALHIPGWPPGLVRQYEDHVLGKLYADPLFERAGDALQKLHDRDRIKGLAYIVHQMQSRAKLPGVLLPPAVIRGLLRDNGDEVLNAAMERLLRDGPSPLLVSMYEQMVAAARRTTELLVREDIDALEDRSALGDMGQYVALRQIRQTTAKLLARLPARPIRPAPNRREVPTRVLDEDQYPVGGYTSIATKGSIESLLHSQLAYIEEDAGEPDLFDVKYTRDELFYYSRDENQFLRRRRAFVFVLSPDLLATRFKDAELPCQRIVMLQSAILAVIEKLQSWLSMDAIRFEVLFVQDGEKRPLAEEAQLMKLLLREPLDRGDAEVIHVPDPKTAFDRIRKLIGHSQVHVLTAATEPSERELADAVLTELVVDGPVPRIGDGGPVYALDGDDPFDVWHETVKRILELWV